MAETTTSETVLNNPNLQAQHLRQVAEYTEKTLHGIVNELRASKEAPHKCPGPGQSKA